MCAWLYLFAHTCSHACAHTYTHIYTHTYTHIPRAKKVLLGDLQRKTYINTHTYLHTHEHTHTYTHILRAKKVLLGDLQPAEGGAKASYLGGAGTAKGKGLLDASRDRI